MPDECRNGPVVAQECHGIRRVGRFGLVACDRSGEPPHGGMARARKQATDGGVPDVPRADDEQSLVPKVTWGEGETPAVGIERKQDKPRDLTASEQAYFGPGLSAVVELMRMSSPSHLAIADQMLAHPNEREAILAEVGKRGDAKLLELV